MKYPGRPRSLAEVHNLGLSHGNVDAWLREFLDEFYTEPKRAVRAAMLAEEPTLGENVRENAYLAATAEHLAFRYDLPVPEWTQAEERFLEEPFFPCGLESLKAICIVQSPPAFRRRMIFVDANPLFRPRQLTGKLDDSDQSSEQTDA
jgi:hypothetical protein